MPTARTSCRGTAAGTRARRRRLYLTAQLGCRPGIEVAVDAGKHQSQAGGAAGKVLRCTDDGIVRRRLDRGTVHASLALGDRVDDADRQSAARAAGQFSRAEDRGRRGRVIIPELARKLRRPPDPSRVEELLVVAVHRTAVDRELEEAVPFQEEWSVLREEGLERAKIEHGRVGLDLAEVRVGGAGKGEIRRHRDLEVRAGRHVLAAIEPGRSRDRDILGNEVGRDFGPMGRRERVEPRQFAEL